MGQIKNIKLHIVTDIKGELNSVHSPCQVRPLLRNTHRTSKHQPKLLVKLVAGGQRRRTRWYRIGPTPSRSYGCVKQTLVHGHGTITVGTPWINWLRMPRGLKDFMDGQVYLWLDVWLGSSLSRSRTGSMATE